MAYESSVPYRAGTEGYTTFRIPAVVRARSGHLLAFAEGRVSSAADSGTIHIVLKRSGDAGRTWGPLQVVARNGNGTAGNPAPVVLDRGPGAAPPGPQRRRRHRGPHPPRPGTARRHLVRPFRPQAGLAGPAVQGSALHLGDRGALLFSGPAHPAARALMTLRTSRDGGLTWRTAHTVGGLPAAYSDLVRLDRHSVGLLYETGDFSAYSTITFRRIPVEEPT
ncbi:hypothetical protein YWIDRAFT_06899 [Streptomyces sp. SceaMP-e96]|nr:hypothetical protein [Streptomyces sp. SID4951]SCK41093.1 hypothetical protein YWIDRAFT_06899 [Streptomyces sp. SceaMP-e96]